MIEGISQSKDPGFNPTRIPKKHMTAWRSKYILSDPNIKHVSQSSMKAWDIGTENRREGEGSLRRGG